MRSSSCSSHALHHRSLSIIRSWGSGVRCRGRACCTRSDRWSLRTLGGSLCQSFRALMTAISHTICHSLRDEAGGPILLFRIKGCNCQLIFCVSCQCVLDAIDMHTPSTPPPWPFSPPVLSSSSPWRDSSRGWRKNVYTSITAHAVSSMSLALESTVPMLP